MSVYSDAWEEGEGLEDDEAAPEPREGENVSAPRRQEPFRGYSDYVRRIEEPEQEVRLWLITFTDVIALMLTFFVMLYAMSAPEEDKWEEVSKSLSGRFGKGYAKPYHAGPQDTISIDKISLDRALSLPYLKSLLEREFTNRGIENFAITRLSDRIVIALPDTGLDAPAAGTSRPQEERTPQQNLDAGNSRAAVAILADTVARIKNRVEVIGHGVTWERAMENAVRIAAILRQTGYERDIVTRAAALPSAAGEPELRGIGIVILRDNGLERELLLFE